MAISSIGAPYDSLSSVSCADDIESNSRLMWNTTIPMMNAPTNTSSSTPISMRNGTRLGLREAEQVDAVLENQVADDLRGSPCRA